MPKKYKYLIASILILLSGLISFFYPKQNFLNQTDITLTDDSSLSSSHIKTVGWKTLQKLDYKSQLVHEELKPIVNHWVKIPGFAVPLSDNLQSIQEFLFVPNQMACIHVPAPPPNLIVYIKLATPMKIEELMGPLWAEGILRVKNQASVYGASAFEMDNAHMSAYIF